MIKNKNSLVFVLMCFAYIFIILGSRANFYVVQANDCRMPVLDITYPETSTHFPIIDKDLIDFYYLSDIFNVDRFYFSIGDLLIVLSMFLVMLSTGILVKYKSRVEYE